MLAATTAGFNFLPAVIASVLPLLLCRLPQCVGLSFHPLSDLNRFEAFVTLAFVTPSSSEL
jgi:hypothetical protein